MESECCRDIFYATHKRISVDLDKVNELSEASRIIDERNDVIARQAIKIAKLEKDIEEASCSYRAYRDALISVEDSVKELCRCLVGCVDRKKIDETLGHIMEEQTEDLLRYIAYLIDDSTKAKSAND